MIFSYVFLLFLLILHETYRKKSCSYLFLLFPAAAAAAAAAAPAPATPVAGCDA